MRNLHSEVRYEGGLWQLDLERQLLGRICAVPDNAVDPSVRIARNDVGIYVKLLVDNRSIILGLSQRDCRERDDWKSYQKQKKNFSLGHVGVVHAKASVGVACNSIPSAART